MWRHNDVITTINEQLACILTSTAPRPRKTMIITILTFRSIAMGDPRLAGAGVPPIVSFAVRAHHHRSRHRHGADDRCCHHKDKTLILLDALPFGHRCAAAAIPHRRFTATPSADTPLVPPLLDESPPFRGMCIKSSYGCTGFTDDTDETCGETEKAETLHRYHRRRCHTDRSHTLCHFK